MAAVASPATANNGLSPARELLPSSGGDVLASGPNLLGYDHYLISLVAAKTVKPFWMSSWNCTPRQATSTVSRPSMPTWVETNSVVFKLGQQLSNGVVKRANGCLETPFRLGGETCRHRKSE